MMAKKMNLNFTRHLLTPERIAVAVKGFNRLAALTKEHGNDADLRALNCVGKIVQAAWMAEESRLRDAAVRSVSMNKNKSQIDHADVAEFVDSFIRENGRRYGANKAASKRFNCSESNIKRLLKKT